MRRTVSEVALKQNLHAGQWAIWDDLLAYRFSCLVAGRRWGKGELAAERVREAALFSGKVGDYAFIAPTYKQGKNIIWGKFWRRFPRQVLARDPNRTNLMFELVNGSRVVILGADNPDSLRGWDKGFRGVVLDEYDQWEAYAFETVIQPMLADWKGWALFTGTPDGFKNLYELWKRGQEGEHAKWKSWRTFKSLENPWLDPGEIEEARRTTDPMRFRQEWEASFEAPTGRVYEDFTREGNASRPCPFEASLPVLVGLDFNIDPMSAVICQRHGQELWVIGEIEQMNSHSQRMGGTLVEKYPRAKIWCDPTGNARSHNIGISDVQILRQAGLDVHFKYSGEESNKYNAVRAMVLNAAGVRRLFIDPSCKRLIERMECLGHDDKDDHLTDALGYLILGELDPVRRAA